MAKPVLKIARELVAAHIEAGGIAPETMSEALAATYQQLLLLQSREKSGRQPTIYRTERRSTDWKKSITKHTVTCLECGASFKQLPRHLWHHNLDSRSYRRKYGIPADQPLASKASTARRKAHAQQSRPWKKSPKYIQAHGRPGKQ